jgi:hypothetical protein
MRVCVSHWVQALKQLIYDFFVWDLAVGILSKKILIGNEGERIVCLFFRLLIVFWTHLVYMFIYYTKNEHIYLFFQINNDLVNILQG